MLPKWATVGSVINTMDAPPTDLAGAAGEDEADALHRAFLAQVAAERGASGHTYKTLSKAAGIPERTLTRYLTGERDMPVVAQVRVAAAFGLTMAELWERAEARWRGGQRRQRPREGETRPEQADG